MRIKAFQSSPSGLKGDYCGTGIGDINGDGYAEVVIPMYSENRVEVWTFEQGPPPPSARPAPPAPSLDPRASTHDGKIY